MTYQSRLLQSLDQQLQQCTDRTERSRLISRRAIHFARLNKVDSAKAEIAALRAELGPALDAGSGAWILLAEGITSYFDLDIENAFDRLRRALGIGKSANIKGAIPLSNAWLSHIHFHKGEYEKTINFLQESIKSSEADDHSSRCRSAIVASNFHGFANQPKLARDWSSKARLHATAEGDEASIAALIFNITIDGVNEARIADAFGLPRPSDYQKLAMELDSSLNYDGLASGVGLPVSPKILKAHTHVVEKYFDKAITLFESALVEGVFGFNRASVEADLSYAYAKLGKFNSACEALKRAIESISSTHDPDDLSFTHARIAATQTALGNIEAAERSSIEAEKFLKEYRELQAKLKTLSTEIPSPDLF